MISPAREAELQARMERLGIREEDLVEKFIRGSGHGGQKINKTSSCVYLKHEPSGLEIKCQQDRSQTVNRHLARCELCDQLEARQREKQAAHRQAREKARRRNRRQSKHQRRKNVGLKRQHGLKKKLRRKPGRDD